MRWPWLLAPCFLAVGDPAVAQINTPPAATSSADDMMAAYRDKTRAVRRCARSGDTIVVCGNRAERNAQQRLPLPREPVEGAPAPRGEVQRASSAPVKQGSCGVVGGQGAGCVGGLPILGAAMLLGKAVKGVIDPDADLSPPPPMPERFKGTGRR
jgi:hypothetical protein